MQNNKIKALINLLDDPDEEVFSTVSKSLLDHGKDIIPTLEKAWECSLNEKYQTRVENIIQDIQFKSLKSELAKWCSQGHKDLLKGAFLISKFQYPELDYQTIESEINRISRDVWLEINKNLTALEKVKIINRIIYDIHGYTATVENYFVSHHSYINNILETKKANAISLSILYITVSESLGIPIYGVNLPNNFILSYMDQYFYGKLFRDNILFYIDPLTNGTVLGRQEIDFYLNKLKIKPKDSYYLPCNNKTIIQRLITILMIAYEKEGKNKKSQLKELLAIVNRDYEGME